MMKKSRTVFQISHSLKEKEERKVSPEKQTVIVLQDLERESPKNKQNNKLAKRLPKHTKIFFFFLLCGDINKKKQKQKTVFATPPFNGRCLFVLRHYFVWSNEIKKSQTRERKK